MIFKNYFPSGEEKKIFFLGSFPDEFFQKVNYSNAYKQKEEHKSSELSITSDIDNNIQIKNF